MNNSIDNPYESPQPLEAARQHRQSKRSLAGSKHLTAILLAILGAPTGAALCSVGYVGIVLLLETALVPPLHSPGTYGQFGFMVIFLGFFGLFYGASFGLIPYTGFALWTPAFLMITLPIMSGTIWTNFDATDVICFAMIVLAMIILALAAFTSWAVRRLITSPNA